MFASNKVINLTNIENNNYQKDHTKMKCVETNTPWGTKAQLSDSLDKLDINLAEAIALCNGIIEPPTQLNSTGNLPTKNL